MLRSGLIGILVATLLPALPAPAQASCAFRGGFAQLQALIRSRVGTCTADEQQPVAVLAVENFYGNLVQQLGGQRVTVSVILSDRDVAVRGLLTGVAGGRRSRSRR